LASKKSINFYKQKKSIKMTDSNPKLSLKNKEILQQQTLNSTQVNFFNKKSRRVFSGLLFLPAHKKVYKNRAKDELFLSKKLM
jgi:hypothetical protein